MLANDVDSARRARDKFSAVAIVGLELLEEFVPSCGLVEDGVVGINVGQSPTT